MLRLLTRPETLQGNACLAAAVRAAQAATRGYLAEDLQTEDDVREFDQLCDLVELPEGTIQQLSSSVLDLPATTVREYVPVLGQRLTNLLEQLDLGSMRVIPVLAVPWLSQKNSFPPVRRAARYFASAGVAPEFAGGLQFDVSDVPQFVPHLFWLVRCNAGFPEFVWSSERGQLTFMLCHYGSLHVRFYSTYWRRRFMAAARELGFRKVVQYRRGQWVGCMGPVDDENGIERRAVLV